MNRNNLVMMLLGFVLVLIMSGILMATLGRTQLVTGLSWGIVVAYAGTLLYCFLVPPPGTAGTPFRFVQGYLPGAVIRYIVMIGVFCAVVFWLDVNRVGVLIGTFAGMMASTFVSLNTMRQATSSMSSKLPEA